MSVKPGQAQRASPRTSTSGAVSLLLSHGRSRGLKSHHLHSVGIRHLTSTHERTSKGAGQTAEGDRRRTSGSSRIWQHWANWALQPGCEFEPPPPRATVESPVQKATVASSSCTRQGRASPSTIEQKTHLAMPKGCTSASTPPSPGMVFTPGRPRPARAQSLASAR